MGNLFNIRRTANKYCGHPTQGRQRLKRYFSLYLLICLLCISSLYTIWSSGYPSDDSSLESQIDNRINPNVADWASLSRLPDVGRQTADAIIRYRNDYVSKNNDKAFQKLDDLANVKGIGPKTLEKLEQYLKFD
ncbi:MAG: helix-hairpin-helix domain-containing protein [Phycisphaerae bacterium]|nr:helix-hairpin-helix domain-containing protein [Phycisphaerae bacterium]